ncbi:hypothetical protein ACROYT_G014940 [Oculina patagonica]
MFSEYFNGYLGSAKFKVTVGGGHVHVLCGDNFKMDVADKEGEITEYFKEVEYHARIHTMSTRSSDVKITGPDELVSAITYRVYCQLATLLVRDIINFAGAEKTLEDGKAA